VKREKGREFSKEKKKSLSFYERKEICENPAPLPSLGSSAYISQIQTNNAATSHVCLNSSEYM
jgi:hypothetical protein